MRALASVVLTSGCLIGGGPSIALRTNGHVALGWDINAGLGPLGLETGQTLPFEGPGAAWYVAATGTYFPRFNVADESTQSAIGARGALGFAWTDHNRGALLSAAPMYYAVIGNSCSRQSAMVLSGQLGVRVAGNVVEVFLAPAIDAMFNILSCT